jgi:phosphoglycolate phosphatase-like HAD superfamily hydrolase
MIPIKSMKQTKVIILDFDGVIVESVGIKDRAFIELYQGHPDHIDAIMSYHLAHNATIRFIKFKYISENILKRTYRLEDERLLSNRFSDLIFKEIVACPFVPGALEFLKNFHGELPLYLVSISPQTELMRILEKRNLTRYFFEVFSSDWKKVDAIKHILHKENIQNTQAIFIGDTYEDYQAALATEVNFVGRDRGKPVKDAKINLMGDMFEVADLISGANDE